jgi:hypothetical protein
MQDSSTRLKERKCDKLSHPIEILEKISMFIIVNVDKGTKYRVLQSMFNFFQGDLIMKNIFTTFVIGIFALFLSAQANAEHHTAQAMEHAGMAQAHGEDGHAKVLLQHAKEALKHAKEAEKVHADAHTHMTEGVKHLKEAIAHAKMGHADVATKHTKEAILHIRQSSFADR